MKALREIENRGEHDFWRSGKVGSQADIMVHANQKEAFEAELASHGITYTVLFPSVHEHFEENRKIREAHVGSNKWSPYITIDEYHSTDEIHAYIEQMATTYASFNVRTIDLDVTYEGRVIKSLIIENAGPTKPNILIDAGIHAREWLSPAVCTYWINQLLENYGTGPGQNTYIDDYNFYILPVFNPDGYEFSQDGTHRDWRKNRADTGSVSGCYGVDLNRNFDYHWHDSGVSDVHCSYVYPGSSGGDQIETNIMETRFANIPATPILSISLHAYDWNFLYPFGYATGHYPSIVSELIALCNGAVADLNAEHADESGVGVRDFGCINAADLYPAAGASDDWYASQGVRYVYTPEMRGPSFDVPPTQIVPASEEMWAALKYMMDTM